MDPPAIPTLLLSSMLSKHCLYGSVSYATGSAIARARHKQIPVNYC